VDKLLLCCVMQWSIVWWYHSGAQQSIVGRVGLVSQLGCGGVREEV
jgi:hypothetical protein